IRRLTSSEVNVRRGARRASQKVPHTGPAAGRAMTAPDETPRSAARPPHPKDHTAADEPCHGPDQQCWRNRWSRGRIGEAPGHRTGVGRVGRQMAEGARCQLDDIEAPKTIAVPDLV